MGKEIKIGLVVITVLLGVLGYVSYTRFVPKASERLGNAEDKPTPAASPKKPLLSGGPAAPKPANDTKAQSTLSSPTVATTDQSWTSADQADAGSRFATPTQRPTADSGMTLDSQRTAQPTTDDNVASAFATPADRYSDAGQYGVTTQTGEPASSDPFHAQQAQEDAMGQTAGGEAGQLEPADDVHLSPSPTVAYPDDRDIYGESSVQQSAAHGTPAEDTPSRRTASPYGHYRDPHESAAQYQRGPYQTANEPQPPADNASGQIAPYSDPGAYRKLQRSPNSTGLSYGTPFDRQESYDQTHQSPDATPDRLENFRRPDDSYVVRPGESFWSISKKVYGSDGYFKALAEHNRREFPRPKLLRAGDVVSTPAARVLEQTYPELCPKTSRGQHDSTSQTNSSVASHDGGRRTYTVEEGDTLFDIARYELGSAVRWVEIHRLNEEILGDDIDYLKPGTKLLLPEVHADRVTQEPPSSAPRRRYR